MAVQRGKNHKGAYCQANGAPQWKVMKYAKEPKRLLRFSEDGPSVRSETANGWFGATCLLR